MQPNDETVMDQMAGLRKMTQCKPVKVITVTGGKGGVGKSNLTVNLAMSLAQRKQKVMIFDADLGLANIDILLGLKSNKNLSHLLNGQATLDEIIINGPHGIKIIPAASGIQRMTELSPLEHHGIIRAFSDLCFDLDILLVDTAAGISDHVMNFSRASHEVIVVVCNEPTSITDAYALMKVMNKSHGIQRFHIVANMVRSLKEGQELFLKINKAAERFLDATVIFDGVVPYDDLLRRSVQQRKPVVDAYPSSHSALAIKQLSKKIEEWPRPQFNQGQISFFLERLINHESLVGSFA